jgi:hypothetical protein
VLEPSWTETAVGKFDAYELYLWCADEETGLPSQVVLSSMLGIDRRLLRSWENGGLDWQTADRVAVQLKVHPSAIWGTKWWDAALVDEGQTLFDQVGLVDDVEVTVQHEGMVGQTPPEAVAEHARSNGAGEPSMPTPELDPSVEKARKQADALNAVFEGRARAIKVDALCAQIRARGHSLVEAQKYDKAEQRALAVEASVNKPSETSWQQVLERLSEEDLAAVVVDSAKLVEAS